MKTCSIVICVLCIVFVDGCRKNASANGHVKSQIHTLISHGHTSVDTINYFYDNQGRQILEKGNNDTPTASFYYPDSVVCITGSKRVIYYLNAQGLATSSNNGQSAEYDINGYKIWWVINAINYSSSFTLSDGNIISSTSVNSGDTTYSTYSYLPNTNFLDFGTAYNGKQNHNLVKQNINHQGNTSAVISSNYIFDSEGRVIERTLSSTSYDTQIFTYTY